MCASTLSISSCLPTFDLSELFLLIFLLFQRFVITIRLGFQFVKFLHMKIAEICICDLKTTMFPHIASLLVSFLIATKTGVTLSFDEKQLKKQRYQIVRYVLVCTCSVCYSLIANFNSPALALFNFSSIIR